MDTLVKRKPAKLEVVHPPLPSQIVELLVVNVDPSSFTSSDELLIEKEVEAAVTGLAPNHANNNNMINSPKIIFFTNYSFHNCKTIS
jgi:hypothetical protein